MVQTRKILTNRIGQTRKILTNKINLRLPHSQHPITSCNIIDVGMASLLYLNVMDDSSWQISFNFSLQHCSQTLVLVEKIYHSFFADANTPAVATNEVESSVVPDQPSYWFTDRPSWLLCSGCVEEQNPLLCKLQGFNSKMLTL